MYAEFKRDHILQSRYINIPYEIKKAKETLVEGSKIGPYKVVNLFKYHCLVEHPGGYKESLSWVDVVNYLNKRSTHVR